jgi:hypothetical protein
MAQVITRASPDEIKEIENTLNMYAPGRLGRDQLLRVVKLCQ